MSSTRLHTILDDVPKSQLQRFYLHWFPGKDLVSSRDRLRADLLGAMSDHRVARARFDGLSRSQQAFITTLLLKGQSFSGTLIDVRNDRHGRSIENYEVEPLVKSLQEAGFIVRMPRLKSGREEEFAIPKELAEALKCTVSLEERAALEMLSREAVAAPDTRPRPAVRGRTGAGGCTAPTRERAGLEERLATLRDPVLRSLAESAVRDHGGIITLSQCVEAGLVSGTSANCVLDRPDWRAQLESVGMGTTGVLSLKEYGLELEEQALVIYQQLIYEHGLEQSLRVSENHREVSPGADLLIDLDRLPELLRDEPGYLTREGNVYKKVEERLRGALVIAQNRELVQGSPVQHLLSLARRLRFLDEDGQRITFDSLRRRGWRKKPFARKVAQVFEMYLSEDQGPRWSFHQATLRSLFLEEIQRLAPGSWIVARPLLTAVVAKYLLGLEANRVRAAYEDRRQDRFGHRRLVVPLQSLYHDLSYWVLYRIALLGLIDAGFRDGQFYSFRLSRLGHRFFDVDLPPDTSESPQLLLNPDFEILIYPEAPEEWNWLVSQFADRQNSDYVKRYLISRESVQRAIVAGWERDEILEFLRRNAYGAAPANVLFSVREWTDGVEFIRKQKVLLLKAQSKKGADRLASVLEQSEIGFERLSDTTLTVRGIRNERAVRDRQRELRDWGLIVE